MSEFQFASAGFQTFPERLEGEREERLTIGPRTLKFGVRYLDLALGGIFPNDLVLIGAGTGIGKTAAATRVAFVNASMGKRVHYFALEAEKREIERRTLYSVIHSLMFHARDERVDEMNFIDWYKGDCDEIARKYERDALEMLREKFKTLHTFYKTADFYAEHFEKMVLAVQDETELLVLDHFHYLDQTDENELRGSKRMIKKIRDVSLSVGKPTIVVGHLRKPVDHAIVPRIEDFHGSSDLAKIATKVIVIAPDYVTPRPSNYEWPTYIAPVKCRQDSTRARFVARCNFDLRSMSYADDFTLGMMKKRGEEFAITEDWPTWARWKKKPPARALPEPEPQPHYADRY
jgi:KaiC/GvpD/RAD55 family RecA-like ATPase